MSGDETTSANLGLGGGVEGEFLRGQQIVDGRFTVEALRGRGGMATVYLVYDHTREREVALKIIGEKYVGKPAAEQRLRNEGAFAQRLGEHPNVARPLECDRLPDGRLYLLTEFVRGPSLADLLAMERVLPLPRACRVARDIADALVAIHAAGLVHRDVKPDNILVAPHGEGGRGAEIAKLIDFGLAGEIEPTGDRLTQLHERPGTRLYMAPEQLVGAPTSPSFDIYALGITLYEALCGFAPNEARSAEEMMRRKLQGEPSIAQFRPDLPASLVELVDACIRPDPRNRIADARSLRAGLDAVLDELEQERMGAPRVIVASGLNPVAGDAHAVTDAARHAQDQAPTRPRMRAAPPVPSHRSTQPGSNRAPIVFAAAVAVLVAVGVAWWLLRPPASSQRAADHATIGTGTDPAEVLLGDDGSTPSAAPKPSTPTPAPEIAVAAPLPTEATAASPTPTPTPTPTASAPTPSADGGTAPPTGPDDGPGPSDDGGTAPTPSEPTPKHPSAPTVDPESDACRAAREQAERAYEGESWSEVLTHTKQRACFTDRNRRTLLRVTAFSELERWAECLREGEKKSDPKTERLVRLCREHAWRGQEENP